MNNNRPIAPGFINRLDKYLLLNRPSVWSARTHLVIYYGFLFFVVLTILAFLFPDDPRTESRAGSWIGLVSVISFIGLVFYIIFLLRFNVFKRFGVDGPGHRLLSFILYFVSIGSFVFYPYVEPYVETVRASNQFTDAEIVEDINTMNLSVTALEYDSVDHSWRRDTAKVIPNYHSENSDEISEPDIDIVAVDTITGPGNSFRLIQQKDLKAELENADSVIRLRDSIYLFFHCPGYTTLSPFLRGDVPADTNRLKSVDIFELIVKNYRKPNTSEIEKTIAALNEKYAIRSYDYYHAADYESRVRKRYLINETSESMENINERMHRFDTEYLPSLFRIHFYITLCLTLVLFIFRHSTPKTFFFSLLTAVVLTILTTIFLAFSYNSEESWLIWLFLYFLLFLIISIFTFKSEIRSLVSGIAINLFVFMLPFIPLAIVGLYYEWEENQFPYTVKEETKELHFLWAEWAGILFFLILLVTYIHRLYRKWYASAEE